MAAGSVGSVTHWIDQAKQGRQWAMTRLWNRYYHQIVGMVSRSLVPSSRRVADEEDVVVAAFATFYRRVQAGEFSHLDNRQNLCKLLYRITQRKAANQIRDWNRLKRGGGRVFGESAFRTPDGREIEGGIDGILSLTPTPEQLATLSDTLSWLMASLTQEERAVAEMKLNGCSISEIAKAQNRSTPTIVRRLRAIRKAWEIRLSREA